MPNPKLYLNLNLILTLKPSLNPQTACWKKCGPVTFQKCPHSVGSILIMVLTKIQEHTQTHTHSCNLSARLTNNMHAQVSSPFFLLHIQLFLNEKLRAHNTQAQTQSTPFPHPGLPWWSSASGGGLVGPYFACIVCTCVCVHACVCVMISWPYHCGFCLRSYSFDKRERRMRGWTDDGSRGHRRRRRGNERRKEEWWWGGGGGTSSAPDADCCPPSVKSRNQVELGCFFKSAEQALAPASNMKISMFVWWWGGGGGGGC